MTDEQKVTVKDEDVKEEESAPQKAAKTKARSRGSSFNPGLGEASLDKSALDPLDLHELIKKNNGTDVELQFYFKGKLMPANTCFYEIFQQQQKEKKKQVVKPQEMPKFDKNNPASLYKHLLASMHRGGL